LDLGAGDKIISLVLTDVLMLKEANCAYISAAITAKTPFTVPSSNALGVYHASWLKKISIMLHQSRELQ